MQSPCGRYVMVFNGEIYNFLELRHELKSAHHFTSGTDTEVLLAAWEMWGELMLHRLVGMFAFVIWDRREKVLFAARDRFGVKPLYFGRDAEGNLVFGSEIKALHAAGVPKNVDMATWAQYFRNGFYGDNVHTFWEGVHALPGGCLMRMRADGVLEEEGWYDLSKQVLKKGVDTRSAMEVLTDLDACLQESIRLRFRADVPVGICMSGGLDSSVLLSIVGDMPTQRERVQAFTACTGDIKYDEHFWVDLMLHHTPGVAGNHCLLQAAEVPALARRVQAVQDEPFSGIPNLCMAKVYERARAQGVIVLLDGNGVDEAWAGYDYYQKAVDLRLDRGPVQGVTTSQPDPDYLCPDFAASARVLSLPRPYRDPLMDLQHRDLTLAKIPRALRFCDRLSMMYAVELREPFLDHRIVELGMRQPVDHKILNGQGKWLVRRYAAGRLAPELSYAPKRAVQTPQREWLQGPLADWAESMIELGLEAFGGSWLDAGKVREQWKAYRAYGAENSFPIWQWVNLGLMVDVKGLT